jgi:hypothetical protein
MTTISTAPASIATCGAIFDHCGYYDESMPPCCNDLECLDRDFTDGGGQCRFRTPLDTPLSDPATPVSVIQSSNHN